MFEALGPYNQSISADAFILNDEGEPEEKIPLTEGKQTRVSAPDRVIEGVLSGTFHNHRKSGWYLIRTNFYFSNQVVQTKVAETFLYKGEVTISLPISLSIE